MGAVWYSIVPQSVIYRFHRWNERFGRETTEAKVAALEDEKYSLYDVRVVLYIFKIARDELPRHSSRRCRGFPWKLRLFNFSGRPGLATSNRYRFETNLPYGELRLLVKRFYSYTCTG